ncbi:MAG: hypothetical protein J1F02_02575 [Lachnospiraceae bacterium]|nr:hypothetical protein [Lachnospiraceae bacterium]
MEKRWKTIGRKLWNITKNHPILVEIFLCMLIPLVVLGPIMLTGDTFWEEARGDFFGSFLSFILGFGLLGELLLLPHVLTLTNLVFLFHLPKEERYRKKVKHIEVFTILLGTVYTYIYAREFQDLIYFGVDWNEVLYNQERHTPVWTGAYPTLIVLALIGVLGYGILSAVPLKKMPPLVIVTAMAGMYLGIAQCVVWLVQISTGLVDDMGGLEEWLLCLLPFNCIIIAAKTIRTKIREWNEGNYDRDFSGKNKGLAFLNQKLCRAAYWPLIAFLLMWPLLGIGIGLLALFGQQPDSVIKAWTETSDWRLSQKIAPPNIIQDDHYLCTVAAGGHRKLVKPLRMGVRRGRRLVVNRQLCIANAFEQIIEEKTPRFHRGLRHFYDTYGLPVSRLIRSRYAADVVYLIMKPLEWLFLAVIYFCDVKPENRIALQYLPKPENTPR